MNKTPPIFLVHNRKAKAVDARSHVSRGCDEVCHRGLQLGFAFGHPSFAGGRPAGRPVLYQKNIGMDLRKAFKAFDRDGSGSLSVQELKSVLTRPGGGQPLSDDEVRSSRTERYSSRPGFVAQIVRRSRSRQLLAE